MLWWRGMRLLLGQGLGAIQPWYAAWAAILAFLSYFTFEQPAIAARLLLISGISCLFYGGMAWLVWRRGQRMRADYLFVGLMVFGFLATLARVVATILNPASTGALLSASPPQMAYLLAYNLLGLLDGIGFFLLATSKLQSELQQMADHDPLTGALNRRALMNQLPIEVAVAQRKSQTIGLIVMDLDHFKQINDSQGHAGGDRILRHFSSPFRFAAPAMHETMYFGPSAGPPQAGPPWRCLPVEPAGIAVPAGDRPSISWTRGCFTSAPW